MTREDLFIDVFCEWESVMGFTGRKACDATRLRRSVLAYLYKKYDDALLGDALKLDTNVCKLRNVGKVGKSMYKEFVEWAEVQLRLDEKEKTTADLWEQRTFDVAKNVFAALVQRPSSDNSVDMASTAIEFAKDFINLYKKEEL
jgi:hypothetical protein